MSSSPAGPYSHWHAVTPHTRPLSITILELAPTSVTLALTRSPAPANPQQTHPFNPNATQQQAQSLASHAPGAQGSANPLLLAVPSSHTAPEGSVTRGHPLHTVGGSSKKKKKKRGSQNVVNLDRDSDEGGGGGAADDPDDDGHTGASGSQLVHSAIPGAYPFASILAEGQTFKDMLSHGVVVTLDGMPWSRIVAHVSDDADEEDSLALGVGEDDEGGWEDEVEESEESLGNTSSIEPGQAPRRRRRARAASTSKRTAPTTAQRSKSLERAASTPRWDRECAVVVVYDLDPCQEHEIELQIVGLASEVKESLVPVSNTVLIPATTTSGTSLHPRSRANSLRVRPSTRSRSNSVNAAATPSPLVNECPPPSATASSSDLPVVPTSILSPIDAQTAHTRHLIAAAHAEREHLHAQIKEARKMAQRSEAAFRMDIESMKRSNEKAGGNDQRNKQKYLALQEQVKQGWAGAEAAGKEAETVKGGIPDIEARLASVTSEVEAVNLEWIKTKEAEQAAVESDKQMRLEEDKKVTDITNKIEKVRARKERKDSERAELQKRIEELERKREDVERKAQQAKAMRRAGFLPNRRWDQPPGSGSVGPQGGPTESTSPGLDGSTVSARPSLNNLHQGGNPNNYPGNGFRPRGGFQSRFPSGGSRPPPQQSPTIGLFPAHAPPSPAWTGKTSPKVQNAGHGRGGTPGPNLGATPFLPSTFPSSSGGPGASGVPPVGAAFGDPALHTAFMPPQLQHRIYLPNSVRPRPTPNFHPPPSVLAEQQTQTTSSASSTSSKSSKGPAFPPLPSSSLVPARATAVGATSSTAGPSLASIVTRAVLAPTSNALAIGPAAGQSLPAHGSPGGPTGRPTSTHSFRTAIAGASAGPDFPPLSPTVGAFHSPPRTTPPSRSPRMTPPYPSPPLPWGNIGSAPGPGTGDGSGEQ